MKTFTHIAFWITIWCGLMTALWIGINKEIDRQDKHGKYIERIYAEEVGEKS